MKDDWEGVGVVHLRDLVDRHRWELRKLPAYLDRLGHKPGELTTSSFLPPSCLIVLNRAEDVDLWGRFRYWLSWAKELHLVLCHYETASAERRLSLERKVAESLGGLPVLEISHWEKGGSAPDGVLQRLKAASWSLPTPAPIVASLDSREGNSPWLELPYSSSQDPELLWPRRVCRREGRPSLYVPEKGCFLDLTTGDWGEQVGPAAEHHNLAVWPDGSRLITSDGKGDFSLLQLSTGSLKLFQGPPGAPLGVWPGGRIGWSGHRCTFHWLSLTESDGGALSACDHDWPAGHEKKQYGYLDNEPCWIQLSLLNDCYLSVYQKDAVLSQSLPIGWTVFGNSWAALAEPASDPTRALFFVHDGTVGFGDVEDACDGDARDARPVIVLGPDSKSRYALDLQRPTYRVVAETVTEVNSEPLDGYAVFSNSHEVVRYGKGRLLGGWGRALTVWQNGRLWREDIVTSERSLLGEENEEISWAFSLPGSCQVVLVHQTETTLKVRWI